MPNCQTLAPADVPPSHLAVPAAVTYSSLPTTASLVANYPPEGLPEPITSQKIQGTAQAQER